MDLKDFVATTLADLVSGLVEAQQKVQSVGAHINPGNLMRDTKDTGAGAIWDNRTNNYARLVQFDIALTVEEGTGTGARLALQRACSILAQVETPRTSKLLLVESNSLCLSYSRRPTFLKKLGSCVDEVCL